MTVKTEAVLGRITELQAEIDYLEKRSTSDFHTINMGTWVQGSISSAGVDEVNNRLCRTGSISIENGEINIKISNINYVCIICFYDEKNIYLGRTDALINGANVTVSKGFVRFMIRTVDYQILAPSIPTKVFSASYNDLELKQSQFKDLVGNTIMSTMLNGVSVTGVEHKIAIACDVKSDANGNIYMTSYAQDDTAHEGSSGAYSVLNIFNVISPHIRTEYPVFSPGVAVANHGTVRVGHDMASAFIDSNTLRMCANINTTDNGWYIAYRDFNIVTKEFGQAAVCDFKMPDGTIYPLRTTDALNNIIPGLNLTNLDTSGEELYMPQIITINSVHYAIICFGNHSHALIKSSDCITWEFVSDIPFGYPIGEGSMAIWGNKIVIVNRAGGNGAVYYPLYLLTYDTANNTWTKLNIPKSNYGAGKPSLAIQNNCAYFCIWVDGESYVDGIKLPRTYKTFYKVNLNTMTLENQISVDFDVPLCDTFMARIGTAIYMFVATDKRGFILTESSDGRSEVSMSYFNPKYLDIK